VHARHRLVPINAHPGHLAARRDDGGGAVRQLGLAAVRADALEEEIHELPLAARKRENPTGPRAVQARERECRQRGREVAGEPGGRLDDGAVLVLPRELSEEIRDVRVDVRQRAGNARGLPALPEASGGPDDVTLKGSIGERIRSRQVGVKLVDHAADLGELAVDLAREQLGVRRQIEHAPRRKDLEHGIER
jgi:hypothetical protein